MWTTAFLSYPFGNSFANKMLDESVGLGSWIGGKKLPLLAMTLH